MMLSIIGIVVGVIAIGLFVWSRKDQDMTNELTDSDVRAMENCYKALMEDFTNYQVDNERKITKLEKQLEIQNKSNNTRMDKMNKSLPSVIRNVVGHIEFAKPLDKK